MRAQNVKDRGGRTGAGRMPTEPLKSVIERKLAMIRAEQRRVLCGDDSFNRNWGYEELGRQIADEVGGNGRSWSRQIRRVLQDETGSVSVDMADRLCIGLGYTPSRVYGLDWGMGVLEFGSGVVA